jgi:DNA invertase Pin-like site-specific DNA recombinase
MPTAYSYIRFSTPEQAEGDSLRRQSERSSRFVEDHPEYGLTLDTSFRDLGVSAFKGDNFHEGALGRFLAAVDDGTISRDSWLLVESLDRLSRDKLLVAVESFGAILRRGLTVVTLLDNKVYSEESVNQNPTDLMLSLIYFMRANDESATKSSRLAEAWSAKQAEAAKNRKPLSSMCPAWLRLSDDRERYVEIPEAVAVVRRVFQMASEGIGSSVIVSTLNREGVPALRSGRPWAKSSIDKILTQRTVLGEYQPMTKVSGRRVSVGDPIKGYYPAIIDPELFESVQRGRQSRRIRGAGRKGRSFTNLLTGIAKCGLCGAALHYADKRSAADRDSDKTLGTKGRPYLHCSSASRDPSADCSPVNFRYDIVEPAVLGSLAELDFVSIINAGRPGQEAQLQRVASQIATAEKAVREVDSRIKRLLDELETGEDPDIRQRLDERRSERQEQHKALQEYRRTQQELLSASQKAKEAATDFRTAYGLMRSEVDPDVIYSIRARINARLKELLSWLELSVWPHSAEESPQIVPHGPPAAFYRTGSNGKVLVISYRLKDDSVDIRARHIVVNTHTREAVEYREEFPKDAHEGVLEMLDDGKALMDDGTVRSLRSFDFAFEGSDWITAVALWSVGDPDDANRMLLDGQHLLATGEAERVYDGWLDSLSRPRAALERGFSIDD